jgi:hypothetical protein
MDAKDPKLTAKKLMLKAKVTQGIVITNVLDYFTGPFNIVGQFTFFYVFAKEIAQYPPEIFMPGVGQETPAVCEHAYEAA